MLLSIKKVWCVGLLAEMKYNIQNYVVISVKSPENKNCLVFITLEWAFCIYKESR